MLAWCCVTYVAKINPNDEDIAIVISNDLNTGSGDGHIKLVTNVEPSCAIICLPGLQLLQLLPKLR